MAIFILKERGGSRAVVVRAKCTSCARAVTHAYRFTEVE